MSIAVTLDGAFDLVQQAAGVAGRFDKRSLFTNVPRAYQELEAGPKAGLNAHAGALASKTPLL